MCTTTVSIVTSDIFFQIGKVEKCQFSDLKMTKTPLYNRLNLKTLSNILHVIWVILESTSWDIPEQQTTKQQKKQMYSVHNMNMISYEPDHFIFCSF